MKFLPLVFCLLLSYSCKTVDSGKSNEKDIQLPMGFKVDTNKGIEVYKFDEYAVDQRESAKKIREAFGELIKHALIYKLVVSRHDGKVNSPDKVHDLQVDYQLGYENALADCVPIIFKDVDLWQDQRIPESKPIIPPGKRHQFSQNLTNLINSSRLLPLRIIDGELKEYTPEDKALTPCHTVVQDILREHGVVERYVSIKNFFNKDEKNDNSIPGFCGSKENNTLISFKNSTARRVCRLRDDTFIPKSESDYYYYRTVPVQKTDFFKVVDVDNEVVMSPIFLAINKFFVKRNKNKYPVEKKWNEGFTMAYNEFSCGDPALMGACRQDLYDVFTVKWEVPYIPTQIDQDSSYKIKYRPIDASDSSRPYKYKADIVMKVSPLKSVANELLKDDDNEKRVLRKYLGDKSKPVKLTLMLYGMELDRNIPGAPYLTRDGSDHVININSIATYYLRDNTFALHFRWDRKTNNIIPIDPDENDTTHTTPGAIEFLDMVDYSEFITE